ncbi:MAG: hypothetical protein A3G21_16360 [Acidobacteria bacterium RIFCSPLOWO2_12_FULL_66_21]|nr:MAG: hypothetical protein A3G21_16360 [Acidobacteria bacterium RIFCSPLOWO2_12_FULL_66_21]
MAKTELRGGAVNARSRVHRHARSARQRRGIDGAEHSAILIDVVAEMHKSCGRGTGGARVD